MLFSQVPVEINNPCAVLLAYKDAVLCEKAKDSVAIVFRNFLGPVCIVYTAYAAAALLLGLRNRRSAIPDRVLHTRETLLRL
jgi:hypothetical protein